MNHLRDTFEKGFANATRFIYRHRILALIGIFALVAGLGAQLRNLTINTANEGFLHADDPILIDYNAFREQFGRDDLVIMAIESKEIFSQGFLQRLKKLHTEIEDTIPYVNDVFSLVNARSTRGEADRLLVDDLLEEWPETDADMAALKARVMAHPLYRNRLISEDGGVTTVVVQLNTYSGNEEDGALDGFGDESDTVAKEFLSEAERGEAVARVQELADRFQGDDFSIQIAGSLVVDTALKTAIMTDMAWFMRLAILTIGIFLYFVFRRISGVVLPLVIVVLSLVSTLGFMTLLGFQFKVPTSILPSFLLAVGVADSVHILTLFYRNFAANGHNKEEAIVDAMEHSGLAIFMTSLTTAAGLASFATAEVAPIADLGLFSSAGVMLAFIYTIVLLPALLAVIPIRIKPVATSNKEPFLDRLLDKIAYLSTSWPKVIVTVSALILVVAAMGASRLHFSHDVLSWLPPTMAVRQATETIDHSMKGTVTLEVVVDTGRENGLYDRDILNTIDRLATEIEGFSQGNLYVGKVMTVTDIVKEINQALHENQPEFYAIPENEKLIPQEFLLFENSGSDDLEDFVDSRFQLARFTIKVPWRDTLAYVPFIKEITARFHSAFGPDTSVTVTGIMALFGRIIFAAIHSAAKSYTVALTVITVMMVLLIGRLRMGLVSMIPNLFPIICIMGFMGWFGFPLDMFTMLIASIAIGLAVDDTIHFMHNFRRYYEKGATVAEAVRETLHTAGRAMLVTSCVLALGFYIFTFATMSNLFNFGLLTGTTILLALAADFLLAPALMALVATRKS